MEKHGFRPADCPSSPMHMAMALVAIFLQEQRGSRGESFRLAIHCAASVIFAHAPESLVADLAEPRILPDQFRRCRR